MKFVVLGDEQAWESLCKTNTTAEWLRADDAVDFFETQDADAYFNMEYDSSELDYSELSAPVFTDSVAVTLAKAKMAANVIRMNGWHGFIEKDTWEMAGEVNDTVKTILAALNKKFVVLKDEPGFVTPRVIAMIINEAFFALGDGISTEEDIDIAMKLGTNYPFGPFEWSRKIGLRNVYELLQVLAESDERYTPAPAMEKTINEMQ